MRQAMRTDFIPSSTPPNIARLLEDLDSIISWQTVQFNRGRPFSFPLAPLVVLGRSFVGAGQFASRPESIRTDPVRHRAIAVCPCTLPHDRRVTFTLLIVAVYLAEFDGSPDNANCDDLLRWLIEHGVAKHKLQPFLPQSFIVGLSRRTICTARHPVSPLETYLLRWRHDFDRNAVLAGNERADAAIQTWLVTVGVPVCGLQWLVDPAAAGGSL
jgi:hypothetical protein